MIPDFDTILTYALGALGSAVRVAIGHDKGEAQGKAKIFATVLAGTVLAGTSNQAVASYMQLPSGVTGAVSFMIGLLGIGFVYQVLDGKIPLPFLNQKDKVE